MAAISFGAAMVCSAFAACGEPYSASSEPSSDSGGPETPAVTPDANDDAADAAHDGDASDAGACRGAFGPLTLQLHSSADYYVDSVTLSNDERDAYVTLYPVASANEMRSVFAMHRADPTQAFVLDMSQPSDLGNTGPTPGAFDVGLSPDEGTLYFSHREDTIVGVVRVDIYKADRAPSGALVNQAKFGATINDPSTGQFHPHPAGARLYFTVAPIEAGSPGLRSLYVAPLTGAPIERTPIAELNAPNTGQANPVPSRDELEIFFSSDRGSPGINRVYIAHRSSAAVTFGAPAPLDFPSQDAASGMDPQHLSVDGCRLYVLVDRRDLYVSTRARN